MPSHPLSTSISQWFSDREEYNSRCQKKTTENWETTPPTVRRRTTQDISSPPSSILQEITNSTRSRHPIQSSFVPVYEDGQDESPTHSWYHDAPSTQQSPVGSAAVEHNTDEMKLREISGNAQRSPPPLSSPLVRQVRGRSKHSLNLRKTSFPASEHIAFLETKLEEVEKTQYSPNSGLPLKDKVKTLTAENQRLQEILAQLEDQFEAKLRESVEHKTAVEVNLRRKIKQLEDEIGSKDSMIRDLEQWNDVSQRDLSSAEAYKVAMEKLEIEKRGLEETNRRLEKRNDVLTELLGHSPTRSHHGFELTSPIRDDRKMTPRPRSVMPRIPTSPTHSASHRPLSLHTPLTPFEPDYFSSLSAVLHSEHDHSCDEDVDPQKLSEESYSVDSGLGESCSVRSGNDAMSKRSSMLSYTSVGPAAWGLPLPPSPSDDNTERSGRKRKIRRFASGSTQLKPLVLPALNPSTTLPQSTPVQGDESSQGRRDISEQSIDPTISFLSQLQDTPTQPKQRSNPWAAEDALKALEGTSEVRSISFDETQAHPQIRQSLRDSVLSFPGLPNLSTHSADPNHFSSTSIDEVIFEEISAPSVSNQVEDAGDQSFSSLAGEVSITESDLDRFYAEEQSLTRHFLESQLPRPLSLELPMQDEAGQLLEESVGGDQPQAHLDGKERTGEPARVEPKFARPSSSTCEPSNVSFPEKGGGYQAASRLNDLDEPGVPPTQASLFAHTLGVPQVQGSLISVGLQSAEMMMPNPVKAVPPLSSSERPTAPQNPLKLLHHKSSPTASLTSVTNQTIFGTISRYTSYIREMRRDPTALARRVIANAWCSNWKQLGKLSWWVLGLFLGPGWKLAEDRRGWEVYDGENIAHAEHERLNGPGPSLVEAIPQMSKPDPRIPLQSVKIQQRKVEFNDPRDTRPTLRNEPQHTQITQGKSCEQKTKISWGRSLYLWGKFSVAIMLAVGGAVIKGPEEMLKDCDLHGDVGSKAPSEYMPTANSLSKADNDPPSEYSMEFSDDPVDGVILEERSPQSFRTAKSAAPPTSGRKGPSFVPIHFADSQFTFGGPSIGEYDCHDDNGQSRPSRSRTSVVAQRPRIMTIDSQTGPPHDSGCLGTLQWMQNLSAKDFQNIRNVDDTDETIGSSSMKVGKRTDPTLS